MLPETMTSDEAELMDAQLARLRQINKLRWKKFPVLDDGFVCLVDVMGDDGSVVQAARVSYGAGTKRVSDDRTLIRYLMRHRHTTPFEMAEVKLLVRVPMDCWRQWIRHRSASVNEYSTRYSEAIDVQQKTPPDQWRVQSATNKQGSGGFLPVELGGQFSHTERELQERAYAVYQDRIDKGVAREQARKDLPLSTYTEAYWKIDLHNLLHFLGLRMDAHAQLEIRQYATTIGEQIIKPLFPLVWEAFVDYRLNAFTITSPAQAITNKLVQLAAEQHALAPYSEELYMEAIQRSKPELAHPDGNGGYKPSRERDEIRSALQKLGLVCSN